MTQHPAPPPERAATLPSPLSPRPHPHGPRNPDHPGSSRTRYHTTPLPQQHGSPSQPISVVDSSETSPVRQPVETEESEAEAVYRPPEPVVDLTDEQPPPYSPGIITESIGAENGMDVDTKTNQDISDWQAGLGQYNLMDVDQPTQRSKPQLGPGVLPRRLLALIHEHELVRPYIEDLPEPAKRIQEGLESPDVQLATAEDVHNALPGGGQDHDHWYFCTTCWGWLRIIKGGEENFPEVPSMEEWELWASGSGIFEDQEKLEGARMERQYQLDRLLLCREAGRSSVEQNEHFHEFRNVIPTTLGSRIERLDVEQHQNLFPHVTFGLERDEKLETFSVPSTPGRLFVSDSSPSWVFVDEGLVPGQIPVGVIQAFTAEKMSNPGPGKSGSRSVNDAWDLLATLLSNPLFKGKRGAVSLANQRVQNCIGQGILTSHVLYHCGFACTEDDDTLRVGPYRGRDDDEVRPAQLGTMERYMLRVWVEICLYLRAFQRRNGFTETGSSFAIEPVRLEFSLESYLPFRKYREASIPLPDTLKNACHILGATKFDTVDTLELAYDLQIAFDETNTPKYLGALETISEGPVYGKESAQLKVAMEKSMDKFTENDLLRAYSLIGYTSEHAETICVAPHEAPDEYILDMHKTAIQACTSPSARQDVNKALAKIGKARESTMMQDMAEKGQTTVSVQEAYEALSAPRDAVDDGLIMQFEMAVNEYPGKADHYRMCLSVIADAPGEERPGLKSFLQTGNRDPGLPARRDIPVGLQNIGNTCYLNSILQYLYSIKPLREAVMEFEQDKSKASAPAKPEVERAKRFVRQLRLLFLQLYKSELPAVRPEEELAYLAITRPEVDSWVESEEQPAQVSTSTLTETAKDEPTGSALDSIPSIPDLKDMPSSPTSTLFASAPGSPFRETSDLPDKIIQELKEEGGRSPETSSSRRSTSSSVLGKRAINERERSFSPGEQRNRLKSNERSMSGIRDEEEKEEEIATPSREKKEIVGSPTMAAEMSHLELQTPAKDNDPSEPVPDEVEAMAVAGDEQFAPPTVPPPSLPPRPPVAKKETLSSGLKFGLQQDSAEVLINILTQLEMALDGPAEEGEEKPNLIKQLYSCNFHQQTIYESALPTPGGSTAYEAAKDTEAVFTHPIIGVEEEGKDLDDCLAELYLKGADIEYEGKKGYMMELMDQFPPMLYIQMRRSQYDPVLKRERKTNTHIRFPQTLSMSRYLVNAPAEKRAESIDLTREMVRIRTRIHALKNLQPLSIPETFKHASSALRYLASEDVTKEIPELEGVLEDDLFDHLDAEGLETEKEIEELQASLPRLKARIDEIWDVKDGEAKSEKDEYQYELVSVYMHRGKTSGSGHYWTYQAHLPDHSEEFYNYNDELVTIVPATEVLQDRTGSDANPALLCYARKGWNLVETLHREVLEQEGEEIAVQQDLMSDGVE